MQPTTFNTFLKSIHACDEAQEWANGKTFKEVYETCHRGDWLLWLFKKTNPDDIISITRVKAHCAKTVEHLMKDERSKNAIQAAIDFADGKINREQLAAYAYAYAAASYASAAASAAAYASYAASASDASDAASYAASDAAYAASSAATYAGAKAANQIATANICRQYLPLELFNITE